MFSLTMSLTILSSPYDDGRHFTVAALQTFSFAKLLKKDKEEFNRLLQAGEKDGFFYLDLTSPESKGLWQDYQGVLAAMQSFFAQPIENKLPFAYGSDVQG